QGRQGEQLARGAGSAGASRPVRVHRDVGSVQAPVRVATEVVPLRLNDVGAPPGGAEGLEPGQRRRERGRRDTGEGRRSHSTPQGRGGRLEAGGEGRREREEGQLWTGAVDITNDTQKARPDD